MENYFVYMHKTPSNKVYIGVTKQPKPELRWLEGKGYIGNQHFCNAIQKYGWDNIEHIILYSKLSQAEAYEKEIQLIAKYNATDLNYGYNHTRGGDSNPMDIKENRDKISTILKEQRSTSEWKSFISSRLMGHDVSIETRQKISKANSGRKFSQECIDRRVQSYKASFTEERRRKISEASKNRIITDECRRKLSEARKGIPMSEEAKLKSSKTKKQKVENGFKLIWIHNDIEERTIQPENAQEYIDKGYSYGRLMKRCIFMHCEDIEIMVSPNEVESYQFKGYVLGPSEKRKNAIKKSNQKYIYFYKGKCFNSAEDLCVYLNSNGYPKIVSSTITEMCRKNKTIKYSDILQHLSREKVR